mgnify:CR=1 FL=1
MKSDGSEFTSFGYQIEKELGSNRMGGRVTYLATDLKQQQKVVIKQFQFAVTGANWSHYDTYDREIQVLQDLSHPGIPRYLTSFQTESGFCMVQEYKEATSLAEPRSFNSDQIRHIAVSILEILVYLQSRIPPVIHRDIKPANILVNPENEVYLVDFGFARVGDGEVGVSSVVKGTLGFMPPEQLFNRQLTEASDLYGLGMTLICLLTGTRADEIGNLVDISYQVKFKHMVPKLNLHWIRWLEKMVEPRMKDRFPNAIAALEALPATSIASPTVTLSHSALSFKSLQLGETLTQTISIENPTPDTCLQGTWEILAPDRKNKSHKPEEWLTIQPQTFEGNQVDCEITVKTNYLMADKTYHRHLVLRTNTLVGNYKIPLQVQTAPIPIPLEAIAYRPLLVLFLLGLIVGRVDFWFVFQVNTLQNGLPIALLSNTIGIALGLQAAAWTLGATGVAVGMMTCSIAGSILGVTTLLASWFYLSMDADVGAIAVNAILGVGLGWVLGIAGGVTTEKLLEGDTSRNFAIRLSLLTMASSIALALGWTVGLHHWEVLLAIAGTVFPLVALLVHTPLRRTRMISRYRKTERYLVQS